MILLRAILLSIFLITPLKANTIYNLIKIPNLEIYEINTKNNLKYFYAARPFRLGTQKNIICLNSNKKKYDEKYKIINQNLSKYSRNFLKIINLKYIILCKNLSISGLYTAGIPDNIMKTLILDIEFNKKYFERVIHHEVFHIINLSYKELFNENEWINFNKKDFQYAKCSTCTDKIDLNTYIDTDGFLTEYSKTTPSEDMAEVFSHIMFNINIPKNDSILQNKKEFIIRNILKVDKTFKF
jgi:hypothetical protein|tara:strand:- start:112 stop:834 length:723 start_codon:yes stop_codon:yes gene_type:complete